MKATLLLRRRVVLSDDVFAEMVLWSLPRRVVGSAHDYKYRLALVVSGECVLRYDNEAGKGDHRHMGAGEQPYRFTDIDALIADFLADVRSVLDEDSAI